MKPLENPNTSELYGEWGIKLKRETIKKMVISTLVILAGIALSYGIFYFVDTVLNGMVLDWIDKNVIETGYYMINGHYVRDINWRKVKTLVLNILIINVVVWLVVVMIVSEIKARKRKKQTISESSKIISDYFVQRTRNSYDPAYAEIIAQMERIKAVMDANEQQLLEEAAQKNDMIAYLAHDLKTPLTSVIGYLSLLNESPDMPVEQKAKFVQISLDKAFRLEELINDFFEITRYNLHQITLEKTPTDIYYLLTQVIEEFYPVLTQHGNSAVLHADENMVINADAEKIARVFSNLLKNAASYSYPNSEIEISAVTMDRTVQITFRNRGRTIPAHKINAIFDKFYRLDESRASHSGGAGLGLAFAKEVVGLHKGTITAESKNDITDFIVCLPVE